MSSLANGKYKNYQTTLEGFSQLSEVENYAQEIFQALAELKKSLPPKPTSPRPRPNPLTSSEGEKSILNATSLAEAQNKAIQELEKFLASKGIKKDNRSLQSKIKEIKEIKEIWKFVRNYKRQVEVELSQKAKNQPSTSQNPHFSPF